MYRKFFEGLEIEERYLDVVNWPQVIVERLDDEEKNIFLSRKLAIDLFMNTNTKISVIEQKTRLYRSEIYRFVRRCLEKDDFDQIRGYKITAYV
ncbi:hypothetical protein [Lederbergia citrea]|uniref:hypothetical protein n=1 Tax=Lederbergia citrea TaxID=2833581 RepID=UPI001BC9D562|nr:hypothetical protein [Lederbergia citrea]MBS4203652.1 hypothetical protein [Lederbergia citrea]